MKNWFKIRDTNGKIHICNLNNVAELFSYDAQNTRIIFNQVPENYADYTNVPIPIDELELQLFNRNISRNNINFVKSNCNNYIHLIANMYDVQNKINKYYIMLDSYYVSFDDKDMYYKIYNSNNIHYLDKRYFYFEDAIRVLSKLTELDKQIKNEFNKI